MVLGLVKQAAAGALINPIKEGVIGARDSVVSSLSDSAASAVTNAAGANPKAREGRDERRYLEAKYPGVSPEQLAGGGAGTAQSRDKPDVKGQRQHELKLEMMRGDTNAKENLWASIITDEKLSPALRAKAAQMAGVKGATVADFESVSPSTVHTQSAETARHGAELTTREKIAFYQADQALKGVLESAGAYTRTQLEIAANELDFRETAEFQGMTETVRGEIDNFMSNLSPEHQGVVLAILALGVAGAAKYLGLSTNAVKHVRNVYSKLPSWSKMKKFFVGKDPAQWKSKLLQGGRGAPGMSMGPKARGAAGVRDRKTGRFMRVP